MASQSTAPKVSTILFLILTITPCLSPEDFFYLYLYSLFFA